MLGKYRVENVLGRGGMAIVLRATHLHLGDEVALKILLPELTSPDVYARFLREAQSVVRLRGEHVARVSDVGVLPEGAPYMVMEYLRGVDLARELKHRGTLSPGEAVDYVLQACEALAEAHAHGIVHRDIKPNNLFLTARPDGTPLVKVLDFGISKAPVGGGSLTRTDTVMGTPGYMSPEQMKAARDVDARTDIWALGIVLYEFLSGATPFQAEAFSAVVFKVATELPPPLDPRLPRGLEGIVLRCLSKDRAGRFASVADLALALAPFARDQRGAAVVVDRTRLMLGTPTLAMDPLPPPPPARSEMVTTLQGTSGARTSTKRFRYTLAGVVSLFGAIGVLSAVALTRSRDPGDASSAGSAVHEPSPPPVTPPGDRAAAQGQADAAAAAPAVAVVIDAAAAPPAPDSAADADRVGEKLTRCLAVLASKDWHELQDCAAELGALGAQDKAEELRAKAVRETRNALAADKLQAALRDGNLREAARQLKSIGADSAYTAAAGDQFKAAEAKAIEDARRRAQALAGAHDCAALKRLQTQLAASSTPGVAAAAAVKCVEPAPPAGAPPSESAAERPADSGSAQPPKSFCSSMNIDDVLAQAMNQFNAGFAKPALSLITKAIACKPDIRMYRLAATYACVAHDLEAAKRYFSKVPQQFQSGIVQRCQQEGINLP